MNKLLSAFLVASAALNCSVAQESHQVTENHTAAQTTQQKPTPRTPDSSMKAFQGMKVWAGAFWEKERDFFGEFDLLIPVLISHDTILFADLRAIHFEGREFEGNIGIGYRYADKSYLWGAYAYYDRKRASNRTWFKQMTLGGELKTMDWSLTVNGYIPFGDTVETIGQISNTPIAATLVPDPDRPGFRNIFVDYGINQIKQGALYGIDAEFGYSFMKHFQLFVGGFYFDRSGFDSVTGVMARGVISLNSFMNFKDLEIDLEGKWRYDNVRKNNGYVGVRLGYTFGDSNLMRRRHCLEKRLLDRPRRDLDIVVQDGVFEQQGLYQNDDGSNAVVALGITDTTDLVEAIEAGVNIMALEGMIQIDSLGNQEEPDALNVDLQLKDNQSLVGGDFFIGEFPLKLGEEGGLEGGLLGLAKNNQLQSLQLDGIWVLAESGVGKFLCEKNVFTNTNGSNISINIAEDSGSSFIEIIGNEFSGPVIVQGDNTHILNVGRVESNNFVPDNPFPRILQFDSQNLKSELNSVYSNTMDTVEGGGSLTAAIAVTGFGRVGRISENTINVYTQGEAVENAIAFAGPVLENLQGNTISFFGEVEDVAGVLISSEGFDAGVVCGLPEDPTALGGNVINFGTDTAGSAGFLFDAATATTIEVRGYSNQEDFDEANAFNNEGTDNELSKIDGTIIFNP